MSTFPNGIPVLPTVTNANYPMARHRNLTDREIEAICIELGTTPKAISELAPKQTPQNVAEFADMFAYIVKKITGSANWYSSAVRLRCAVGGHGGGTVIAAAATRYLEWYGRALTTTAQLGEFYMNYPCMLANLRMQITTAQPGTGSLVLTVLKNGVSAGLTITIPAGSGAFGVGAINSSTLTFAAGDVMSVSAVNNAATNSAGIGSFSAEFDQIG